MSGAKFTRSFDIEVTLDPEHMARLFAHMGSDDQARFLIAVARDFQMMSMERLGDDSPAAGLYQMEYIAGDLAAREKWEEESGTPRFVRLARAWVDDLHERICRGGE